MSDTQLLQMLQQHVYEALSDQEVHLDEKQQETVTDALMAAIRQYRDTGSGNSSYEAALGSYIIGQNPYARSEQLEFPNLPLTPNGENRWVRKNGVLAHCSALNPLPRDESIPAGTDLDFSYADWEYLRELPGPAAFQKPEGDQKRPPGEIPPDLTTSYRLHIVKSIRLRYTLKDRRYLPKDVSAETPRDLQTGYIVVSYAGGNNG
jgi:hypothetical protein